VKELSSSSNIKDKNTRKDVQTNLKTIMNSLKLISKNKINNGLLILSGINDFYV
jgi:peptide subunit release factor 1 (eRF1)